MRKISAVKDRAIRVQAVQAINNSALRHQVFAKWVDDALTKRAPGHDAQVVGFVSEDVADFARNGGMIYVPVDAADNVKPHGKPDAVVNAYRLAPTNEGTGSVT